MRTRLDQLGLGHEWCHLLPLLGDRMGSNLIRCLVSAEVGIEPTVLCKIKKRFITKLPSLLLEPPLCSILS